MPGSSPSSAFRALLGPVPNPIPGIDPDLKKADTLAQAGGFPILYPLLRQNRGFEETLLKRLLFDLKNLLFNVGCHANGFT